MKATAEQRSAGELSYSVRVRSHDLIVDEPLADGGEDSGPTPQELLAASLASCVGITIEMYARRKGWEVGPAEVECSYAQAERGQPTEFSLVLRLPRSLSEDQVERLAVIAGKCPVHRILEGAVSFEERIELVEPRGR